MKTEVQTAIVLLVVIILTRTLLHVAPNVEFVTGAGISAGLLFKNKRLAFAVIAAGMIITDLVIGNSIIFVFTWSGFLLAPLLGLLTAKKAGNGTAPVLALNGTAAGVISTLLFFLWTNLGVVLTTNMYSRDLSGLLQSYLNALPFLKNQLGANLLLVPLLILAVNYTLKLHHGFKVAPHHNSL